MVKFNKPAVRARARGPVATGATPTTVTHEGGPAYVRDAKGELFMLAVSNMVGEDTFYEQAGDRDGRYRNLVRQTAVEDPMWTAALLRWLRTDGNMRSASLVGAAEFVKARLDPAAEARANGAPGLPGEQSERGIDRVVIDSVLQRADEPGELLAYWLASYGRKLPKPVKRGVADAARRLYTEYSLLKYDTASHGVRFADVLDLTHPAPATPAQGALFRHALDRRHGRDVTTDDLIEQSLPMLAANARLRAAVAHAGQGVAGVSELFDPEALREAGMTWEDALSLAGPHVNKAKLWEAMIPSMGYMALLRNLRNFDEAGVSRNVAEGVAAWLADPALVARSRQLPYRFWSAYQAVTNDRWRTALGDALDAACANVPALPGRNLVLIDTSSSMTTVGLSSKSKITAAQAAAVFGMVLAKRCNAEVYGFANGDRPFRHDVPAGASVLSEVAKFLKRTGQDGHGTNIYGTLARTWRQHDRVFILSDGQTVAPGRNDYRNYGFGTTADPTTQAEIFAKSRVYGFNLSGYVPTPFPTSGLAAWVELGGLSDATFKLVPLLERGSDAPWPWEVTA